jgi:predicted transposase YbfD/YdcC
MEVTPEEMGFTGARQIIAIRRTFVDPKRKSKSKKKEASYYISSLLKSETTEKDLLEISIGHWSAIENGTHYVRDVSLGEDASRIHKTNAAQNMVTLRNLVNTIHGKEEPPTEGKKKKGRRNGNSVNSKIHSTKPSDAVNLLRGKLLKKIR